MSTIIAGAHGCVTLSGRRRSLAGRVSYSVLRSLSRSAAAHPWVEQLYRGLVDGSRACLAESITLVESTSARKRQLAQQLLSLVIGDLRRQQDFRAPSLRIAGVSGPPGAGKSTFIERIGKRLTSAGHRLAVLAVDPSSNTTGGSLLGDKTRMPQLTVDPRAYIRPSPTGGHLGGVTRATRDSLLLCELARYDMMFVETGLKRGIVEMADLVVINKSDGDLVAAAQRIQAEYISALKFIRPRIAGWRRQVVRVSCVTGDGLDEMWSVVEEYRRQMTAGGLLAAIRRRQTAALLQSQVTESILAEYKARQDVVRAADRLERAVLRGEVSVTEAADQLVDVFFNGHSPRVRP